MILKGILFLGLSGLIYWQISNFNPSAWAHFELKHPLILLSSVLLVVLNIGLVYQQWKLTLNVISPQSSKYTRVQSFFAGLVTGMLTPNMLGNFIGRAYYFDRDKRSSVVLFTLLANYSQFLASLIFGWISVVLVGDLMFETHSKLPLIGLGSGVIVSILIYFFIDNFLMRFKRKSYFIRFHELLKSDRVFRLKLLLLAVIRFAVFTTQFALILYAFGETLDLYSILAIWQVYLLTMLVPSIVLGKIGVKESIALFVLAGIGFNGFSILFASLIIWFVNSLSPALVGLIISKRKSAHVTV